MSKRWMMLITVLAVLGLVAAACGDDGDEGGDTTDTEAPETTQTTAAPDEGEDTDGDDDATDPAEDIVLTDSFRGVTADTIKIGATAVDFDALRGDFGLDLTFQAFAPQVDAIVAWYNENGGVLGRQIEVVHEIFLPVGAVTAEEACVRLTEDEEVFAVINGFSGPGAEDQNVCFGELHDTILVGGLPSADQATAAGGLWVTTDMSPDRRIPAGVDLLDEAGLIEELGTVMVVGSNPIEEPQVRAMAEAFRSKGLEVPVEVWVTTSGDEQATQSEVEVFIERARSEGVTTVAMIGEGEFRNGAFFADAPEFTYYFANGDRITDWQAIPPLNMQEGTRVLTNRGRPASPVWDDRLQECIDVVEAAQGVEVKPPEELGETDDNYWSGTSGTCQRLAMFVQIAEAAGPDLTNDSWIAALDQVPDLGIPGYEFVSISADKVDARDELLLAEYDLATLSFDELTEPVDLG